MVDADVISAKLRELEHRIARVAAHCPPDAFGLAANPDALDLVSFNLLLAVQVCLDIASHLIADEGWPAATSLGESFQRLNEHGVLTRETTDAMRQAAGLRNFVAHGYADISPHLVHTAALHGLPDLEHFAREVAGWLRTRL